MNHAIERGSASPLGCQRIGSGINFALFSQEAKNITLYLFHPGSESPYLSIPLNPKVNKTGWVWHIWVGGLPNELYYAYSVEGEQDLSKGLYFDPSRLLTDPYAYGLNTSSKWGEGMEPGKVLSKALCTRNFHWESDHPPQIPLEDLVIYEMHVRGFTAHSSSRSSYPGTYKALIDKIPHLKKLGVNAVELLPIFEFNEMENSRKNPKTQEQLFNYWGYSTVNYFSPMPRYAHDTCFCGAVDEFKLMVKELHKHGIEVILDVVYNHTAEGNHEGPWFSFRGIDNPVYYMMNEEGKYLDYTGCGNTFNCNNPVTTKFIVDSLRYWVNEMHVDGFRFDLASAMTRDSKGTPMAIPPVIKAITEDPILSGVKLIAEAWDAGGLYQVGSFPGEGKWSEWNGRYRDVVRRFIKGTDGQAAPFARSLCGSDDMYGAQGSPNLSINFITAHDGFSLHDLVSYQQKHNEDNGEDNRDGMNENDSWNCGAEGPTHKHAIQNLRERQMKNFFVALMVSLGVPMILMGDEYGHTRKGNNNPWGQDNEFNWFLWNFLEKNSGFFRFCSLMVSFRYHHKILRRKEFLRIEEVEWHGTAPLQPNWGNESRLVAYTLKDPAEEKHLYIAFNADFKEVHLTLPHPPHYKKWYRVVDTSKQSPEDILEHPFEKIPLRHTYNLSPYSALILQAH